MLRKHWRTFSFSGKTFLSDYINSPEEGQTNSWSRSNGQSRVETVLPTVISIVWGTHYWNCRYQISISLVIWSSISILIAIILLLIQQNWKFWQHTENMLKNVFMPNFNSKGAPDKCIGIRLNFDTQSFIRCINKI